jgi:hypothetical protein
VIVLVFSARAQATTDDAIEFNVQESASQLTNQSEVKWRQTAEVFSRTNQALELAVYNISQLYIPADRAAFVDIMLGTICEVAPSEIYAENATAVFDYLCCQVRRLRSPALQRVIVFAHAFYFGVAQNSAADTADRALINFMIMQSRDLRGYIAGSCKDDRRLHDPQQSLALALEAGLPVAGTFRGAYNLFAREAVMLRGCIGQPLINTGCLQNTELTLAQVTPNTNFIVNDPSFQDTCVPQVLANFEFKRLFTVCPP